jgi:hypothetical protein
MSKGSPSLGISQQTLALIGQAEIRVSNPREKAALRFLGRVAARGRIPQLREIARAARVCPTAPYHWREFQKISRTLSEQLDFRRWGQSVSAKIEAAKGLQECIARQTGCLPSLARVASAAGIGKSNLQRSLAFSENRRQLKARFPWRRGGKPPSGKQAKAIGFLRDCVAETRIMPSRREIAKAAGCSTASLSHWPRFLAIREQLTREIGHARPGPVGRVKDEDTRAQAFLKEFEERTGRLPTIRETAKAMNVGARRPRSWPGFLAARRHAASRLGIKLTGHWPTGKEEQAIAFLKGQVASRERPPTVPEVAKAVGVAAGVPHAWERFQSIYRKAASSLPSPESPHADEGGAIWLPWSMIQAAFRDRMPRLPSGNLASLLAHWRRHCYLSPGRRWVWSRKGGMREQCIYLREGANKFITHYGGTAIGAGPPQENNAAGKGHRTATPPAATGANGQDVIDSPPPDAVEDSRLGLLFKEALDFFGLALSQEARELTDPQKGYVIWCQRREAKWSKPKIREWWCGFCPDFAAAGKESALAHLRIGIGRGEAIIKRLRTAPAAEIS